MRAAGRDARHLAEDHPALQLCAAEMPEEKKQRVAEVGESSVHFYHFLQGFSLGVDHG